MKTANPNLKKAAAGAEAPHRSVQSAKRVANQIGGHQEYREKVEAIILRTCSMFGGKVVGMSL